ncbi:flagellar hook associated protein, partial [Agrobacterium sp. ICMP 6402]|nr:flagellar hook associated protein [Agrobacterium sp. ICMP 6402]
DQLKSISSSSSFSGENWLQAKISDGAGNLTDVTKQVVGSFIRDAGGNVSVKTINVALTADTVLFDTSSGTAANKTGILDTFAYYSKSGTYDLFKLTAGATAATATTKVVAAETYTEAQLKASALGNGAAVADYEVMANGLAVIKNAAAGSPIAATGTYLKVGDDKYVKIISAAAGAPAASDGPTAPIVNTSIGSVGGVAVYLDQGAASTADKLAYSLTSLDITKDLVGPTGVTQTAEQSLDTMISFVDKQLQSMTSAAADLGSVKMRIELQENFV